MMGLPLAALTWEGDATAARCLGTPKRKRAALVVVSGAKVNKHTVRPFKDSDASAVRALFQKGMTGA